MKRTKKKPATISVVLVALLLVGALCSCGAPPVEPAQSAMAPAEPEPPHITVSASIGTMGDLLMHRPVFQSRYNAAVQQADGSYDFSSVFRYLTEYTSALDYAVINLETTLCGEDNGYAYSGFPHLNCPDALVDGVKAAGFDMLLTANNHSYDTGMVGFHRTLEVVRGKGLATLGTYASAEEPKWTIVDINGIKVGMLCYTWASFATGDGRPSLNANAPIKEAGLCNYFVSGNLPAFYSEVEQYLNEMDAAGADATMLFIHWGQEYQLSPNSEQQAMAQALCDLGLDVIVGSHPHVVQPIDLLESTTDPTHKTVCLYSTGNAVSNQRRGNLSAIRTAHTEDGLLFSVTFDKYSDGTVYLSAVDALPTWVNKHTNETGKREFNILPLQIRHKDEWSSRYELSESSLSAANDSYDRTMNLIGPGLAEVQAYLIQQNQTAIPATAK